MKKAIFIILGMLLLAYIPTVCAEDTGHGSFVACCDSVKVGEEFTITFYIDTNYNEWGFTIRQMTWESSLAGLIDVTFEGVWISDMNDPGDIQTSGNLTYLIAWNSTDKIGYNPAVTFTFTALNAGTLHLNIPDTIWSGQSGFVADLADITTWSNTEFVIESADNGNDGNGGNGGNGGTPPTNNPPTAIIDCPVTAYTNETITFSGTNSTDDGTIIEYSWGFGDNHTGTGRTVNYSYFYPGTYVVLLSITDDGGLSDSTFVNITIESQESPSEPDEPDIPDEPDEPDIPDEPNVPDNNQTNYTGVKDEPLSPVVYVFLGIFILLSIVTILKWKGIV